MTRTESPWLAVLAALTLLLGGCTGSQEARTPVALIVAGDDGSGGSAFGLIATGLPPSGGVDDTPLRWLDGFERTVGGSFVDLAVARDVPDLVHLLTRQGDSDLLTRFDASALDFADPSSLARVDAVSIDVSEIVANSGSDVLSGEALCSRGMSVSRDGRWLGLLHDPAGCSLAASTPTVLLVEIVGEGGAEPRVGPSSPSTDDAAATPVFSGTGDDAVLVWSLRLGSIRTLSVSDPLGPVAELVEVGLSGDPAIALGATGLVAADEDWLVSFQIDGNDVSDRWPAPPAAGTLYGVVDSSLLPSTSAIALSDGGVVVVPDVDADPAQASVAFASVAGIVDATVDPYAYLYAVSPSGIVTFDLLRVVTTGTLNPVSGASASVAAFDPLAVDWLFGTSSDEP